MKLGPLASEPHCARLTRFERPSEVTRVRRVGTRIGALAGLSLWLAFACAPVQAGARALSTVTGLDTGPAPGPVGLDHPAPMPEREDVLRHAEAALAQGHTVVASEAFDRASLMLHAADTEMGQVRAAMQAGQYRRALALAAHTAGAHLESPHAAVLYAWLLRAGGQARIADRVLAEVVARSPGDAVAAAASMAFRAPLPVARGVLLDPPHRTAPHAWAAEGGSRAPAGTRVMASGALVAGGQRALVPAALLRASADRVWLRNGLGQTVVAVRDTMAAGSDVAMFRLESPLPFEPGDEASSLLPFAGSPAFIVEYASAEGHVAAWPWLRQGFVGGLGRSAERRLGIDPTAGLHGGVLLNDQGRLVGIAVPPSSGPVRWLPAAIVSAGPLDDAARQPAASSSPRRLPIALDEAYERGLRLALQVIALP